MEVKYCKCGCKTAVKNEYANGHYGRKSPVDFVVENHGYKSCCWIWKLNVDKYTGYARIKRDGKGQNVHKYYWEKVNGKVPDGLVLDHLCRIKKCMRPDHLEAVTVAENTQRGLSTPLTVDDVKSIILLYRNGSSQYKIARDYNIAQQTVSGIVTRKTWKAVELPACY